MIYSSVLKFEILLSCENILVCLHRKKLCIVSILKQVPLCMCTLVNLHVINLFLMKDYEI